MSVTGGKQTLRELEEVMLEPLGSNLWFADGGIVAVVAGKKDAGT
jgi:hypothetical protein